MNQGIIAEQPNSIWVSAVETSADLHGADLMLALQEYDSSLSFSGIGGVRMREQGLQPLARSEDLSVMGISEVLWLIPRILSLQGQAKRTFRLTPPDCLVLIDAPDFHFPLAKAASKLNIPVYYYISPQVWAWRKRRIRFMQRYIRRMLCILPFEEEFYRSHNVRASFVGHPLIRQLQAQLSKKGTSVQPERISVLPGSRKMEIKKLGMAFARAAELLYHRFPWLEFNLVQAPGISREELLAGWPEEVPATICPFQERYDRIQSSVLALTASGTASLECALLGTPAIVAYRVSGLSYSVARLAVDVPYISLPNLILNKMIFPEFIQSRARGELIAKQAEEWLTSDRELNRIRGDLSRLRSILGSSDAPGESARIIWSEMYSTGERLPQSNRLE